MGVPYEVRVPPAFRRGSGRLVFWAIATAALALGVCLAPWSAFAQEDSPAEPDVPEITIRGEAPPSHEPQEDRIAPATVLTREEIERTAGDTGELLEKTVGVQVREIGGFDSYSTVSIRGSSPDQVRVFLDGIPLGRGTSGTVDLSVVPLELLDRAEVYRSVSPAAFGGSAIGGVVSLTSRRPEKSALSILGGAGSYGWRRTGISMARAEEGEKWSGNLSLLYEGAENDFSFTTDNGTPANLLDDFKKKQRNADYNRGDALGHVRYELPGNGSLSFIELLQIKEGGITPGDLYKTSLSRQFKAYSSTSLHLDLPEVTERGALGARTYFAFRRDQIKYVVGEIDDRDYLAGVHGNLGYDVFNSFSVEGSAQYDFEVFDPSGNLAATPVGPSSRRHYFTVSGSGELELWEEHLLLLGTFRYERAKDRLRDSNAGKSPLPGVKRDGATAGGGVALRPVRGVKLSGNFSKGVRFPDFTELFGNTDLIRGSPALLSEKAWTADGGISIERGEESWARRFFLEARYFHRNLNYPITFQATAAGVLVIQNLWGSKADGVEVVLDYEAPRLLRWEGNFTYLRDKRKAEDPVELLVKFDVPYSPRWQGYTRLELAEDFAEPWSRVGCYGDFEFVSSNFQRPANLSGVPERKIWGAGVFAELLRKKLKLLLEVKNLTDEKNLYNFINFPLPGRTFQGTVRWEFL